MPSKWIPHQIRSMNFSFFHNFFPLKMCYIFTFFFFYMQTPFDRMVALLYRFTVLTPAVRTAEAVWYNLKRA